VSLDVADDLESAEETISTLQEEVRRLAEFRHGAVVGHAGTFATCMAPTCEAIRELLTPWQRPTCADGVCERDICGGYHPDDSEPDVRDTC